MIHVRSGTLIFRLCLHEDNNSFLDHPSCFAAMDKTEAHHPKSVIEEVYPGHVLYVETFLIFPSNPILVLSHPVSPMIFMLPS